MRIVLAAAVPLVMLAGCGEQTTGTDAVGADPGVPVPTTAAAEGEVGTRLPVTVLDDGDGAELCLGGVAESLPPQCAGPRLVGWDWAAYDGYFEEVSGVRWGEFHVVGTYDGTDVTPTRVTPAAVWQGPALEYDTDLTTPCPEPDGGWRVLDPALTTQEAVDRTFQAASMLPGYAASWMDRSRIPDLPPPDDGDPDAVLEYELAMGDPTEIIVNVKVTGDPAEAEVELRKLWGGMLCVTGAERSEAELRAIDDDLLDFPGALHHGTDGIRGVVELTVIYDDGTLQTHFDEQYGEGLVVVSSALRPVG